MALSIASSPAKRGITEKPKEKQCKFPGCNVKFMGIGSAKYCEEHRDPKYRPFLNEYIRKKKEMANPNYIDASLSNCVIEHNEVHGTKKVMTCPCGKSYTITLYPNVTIYPKYCEEHRNPYQREKLLKKLNNE